MVLENPETQTSLHEAASELSPREKAERGRFIRMMYSRYDLQLALSAITFLSECEWERPISTVDLRRYKCFETTAIVAYTRPFVESRGGHYPLNFKMINFLPSAPQLAFHDEIINLRNKVIAHSDFDMMRMVSEHYTIPMPHQGKDFVFFQSVFDEGITLNGKKCDAVENLIRYVFDALVRHLYSEAQNNPGKFSFRHDYMDRKPIVD
jgi:hypothetical protein